MKAELQTELVLIGILACIVWACHSDPVVLDYCQMITDDQSYVNTDKSNWEEYQADKLKRQEIFHRNFHAIMEKTRQEGFPGVRIEDYQQDSCKYWAVSMTMIHTAQSDPALFFSREYAHIFQAELDKGNLERKLLEQSCIITAKTIDLCMALNEDIAYATELWGIDFSIFDEANFIRCD